MNVKIGFGGLVVLMILFILYLVPPSVLNTEKAFKHSDLIKTVTSGVADPNNVDNEKINDLTK